MRTGDLVRHIALRRTAFKKSEVTLKTGASKPRRKKSARTLRIDKLDTMWSLAVRLRDNFTDRKTHVRNTEKGELQGMHIFVRANYSTRWLTDNGLTGNYGTHIGWAHHHPAEFTVWAQQEIGPKAWKHILTAYQHPIKLTNAYMDAVERQLLAEIDKYGSGPDNWAAGDC
jgi:hypothetical protein